MPSQVVTNDVTAITPKDNGRTKSLLINSEAEKPKRTKRCPKVSKITAAYIAGFVDGEGCICIYKRKRRYKNQGFENYTCSIKIANTDKRIMDWFKNSFGGNLYKRVYDSTNQKNAYCWELVADIGMQFVQKIVPYLKVKRKQAELLLEFRKTFNGGSYDYLEVKLANGGHGIRKAVKKEVVERRENIYQQLRHLNHRGKKSYVERLSEVTPKGDAIVRT